ncbi:MAG: erythromycin esterase family protein [Methylocystis silviterrae]
MVDTKATTIDRENVRSGITRALAGQSESLPPPERAEHFGEHFARFGDAQVVLLGEATHGTSEFYRARAAITRELVRNHGFTIVAVEADWPDAAWIDRYVRIMPRRPSPAKLSPVSRLGCGATSK